MKNIFCHTNNNDFSAQKPTLLKKQPNVIKNWISNEKVEKPKKPKKPPKTVFFGFFQPRFLHTEDWDQE
jgi:hypothetical protein